MMATDNTKLSDFSIIAQAFEKGAHATTTEAATFAPMSRSIQNNKIFAKAASKTLQSYKIQPTDKKTGNEGQSESPNNNQGLTINNRQLISRGDSFGSNLMDWVKDCIPCNARVITLLEIKPNIDLLGIMKEDLSARLNFIQQAAGLLNNAYIYGDFCQFLSLLNFMCIPDLQRLIALLSAMLSFQEINLNGMFGILQALVAPLFSGVLMGITSMLDQFNLAVISPIDCIVDAIDNQLSKLGFALEPNAPINQINDGLKGGLQSLRDETVAAKQAIQNKLAFYIEQIKALSGDLGASDLAYLQLTLKKLTLLRLIFFIQSIITSLSKGTSVCTPGQSPQVSELDNFFNAYVNPNSSFNLWIDQNGDLQVDDTLQLSPKMLEYIGENPILEEVNQAMTTITQPVKLKIPCKLETSQENSDKMNQWLTDLNKV